MTVATPTILFGGSITNAGVVATTTSIAPAANKRIVLFVSATSGSNMTIPVVTGLGLTWDFEVRGHDFSAIVASNDYPRNTWMYSASTGGSAPTPGAVTITFNVAPAQNWGAIVQFGSDAVQTADMIIQPRGRYPDLPPDLGAQRPNLHHEMAALSDPDNAMIHWSLIGAAIPEASFIPDPNFTKLGYYGGNWHGFLEYKADGGVSTIFNDWAASGLISHWVSVAFEVRATGAAATTGRIRERLLVCSASSSDGTVFTTPTCVPYGNRDIWVGITSEAAAEPLQPTITGGSLTWTLVGSVPYKNLASPKQKLYVFRARTGASTPTPFTITATYPSTQLSYALSALETRYSHATAPVMQIKAASGDAALGVDYATTFDGQTTAKNSTLLFVARADYDHASGNEVLTGTPGPGWVPLNQDNTNLPVIGITSLARNTPDPAPSFTGRSAADWGMLAIEVREETVALGDPPPYVPPEEPVESFIDLPRPVPDVALEGTTSTGDTGPSTYILDAYADQIELDADAIYRRTSEDIITTDQFDVLSEVVLADGESTTGWHAVGTNTTAGTGSISASSSVFTLTTGTFASTDAGITIRVVGAGAAGADLVARIVSYQEAVAPFIHANLSVAAGTTVSGAVWNFNAALNTSPVHTQGTSSIQAYMNSPSATGNSLYLNLTEAGYATGLDLMGGQNVVVDLQISEDAPSGSTLSAFNNWNVMMCAGVDLTGASSSKDLIYYATVRTDDPPTGKWHRIVLPTAHLTNIKSIGIKKVGTGGSGSTRIRWHIDNIRVAETSPLDQAYQSGSSSEAVTVMVPASSPVVDDQLPILPESLKSLVDFRPDHAVFSGLGGVRNIREWGLDETGVNDMGAELQDALDSLSPGDYVEFPPEAIIRCDDGIRLNVPNVTIDGRGAALTQGYPDALYDGVNKIATSGNDRVAIIANGVTLKRMRVFGASITPQNGSLFTTTGGTVSGTTMQLDAQNDTCSFANTPGRDPLGRIRYDLVLSDSTQAANDCVVTITDDDGVVLYTETRTLTATPTAYSFYALLRSPFMGTTMTVTKATVSTNIITLTQMRTFNNCQTTWTFTRWEFGHGIDIVGDNVTVEDCTCESVMGDGMGTSNKLPSNGIQNLTVRRFFNRGCGRQGIAIKGGRNHRFEECYLLYAARHGVDFEPEDPDDSAVDTVFIKDMFIWKSNTVPPFSSGIPAGASPRNRNIVVDGLRTYAQSGGIGGGFMDSRFTRLELRTSPGGNNADSSVIGKNVTWDDVRIDGAVQMGVATATTGLDENGASYVLGGLTLKNCLFMKPVLGAPYLTTESIDVHLENLRISDSITLDTNYAVGGFQILADTSYTGLDFTPYRAALPNSYPGVAIGQPWFPAGLDMNGRGLLKVGYLSGGATRGNNLGRFQAPITAGQSTLTVAFPAKTYPNVLATALTSQTGGTLTAGTHNYRIAARNRLGGPVTAAANQATTLTTGTAVNIVIDNLYDTVTGIAVDGITVYRGASSSAPYGFRYDVVPSAELYAMGGGSSGTGKRVTLKDLGTSIIVSPGGNNFFSGYTFPFAVQTGSFTPADETGFEPDTNYAVFVETSWQTTWRVTARRRDGFDLEFGVPAPTGSHTVSYMIARF